MKIRLMKLTTKLLISVTNIAKRWLTVLISWLIKMMASIWMDMSLLDVEQVTSIKKTALEQLELVG